MLPTHSSARRDFVLLDARLALHDMQEVGRGGLCSGYAYVVDLKIYPSPLPRYFADLVPFFERGEGTLQREPMRSTSQSFRVHEFKSRMCLCIDV